MQQKIEANYNKNSNREDEAAYEDAVFITFLDFLYDLIVGIFIVFGVVSFSLFLIYEILPFLT